MDKKLTKSMKIWQGWRKQFYIGQAESLDSFECMENVATHIYTQATYIVRSIISMQGLLMLGDLRHGPQENFGKQLLWDWIWGISGLNYIAISHFNWKLISNYSMI